MISKKIKVTLLAAVLMVTGIAQTTLANTTTKKDKNIKIESKIENSEDDMTIWDDSDFEDMDFEEMSFEDLVEEIKEDISKEDLAKLEKIYKEATALEESEKYDEADKKWEEFDNIFDKYIPEMTFEDFVSDMKEDIKKEDLVKLEKIFNEAIALEKEEKFEAAEKKWDEVFNILDKYMPEMDEFEDIDFEEMTFEKISFKDFIGEMKKDIKKEDLAKLEKIYNKAMDLEKEDKYEEADKEWDKFYKILPEQDFSGIDEELGN